MVPFRRRGCCFDGRGVHRRPPARYGGIRKRVTGSQIDNPGELIKIGVAAILEQFPPPETRPKPD